jgi:type I restriction enzyme S subunit
MILSRDVPVAYAEVPMAFNQDMKAIVARDRLDGEYLLYALVAFKGRLLHEIGSAAHGTKRISTSAIENILLPLPPFPEQRAIAGVLKAVQAAKAATEAVLAATRDLKASLLRHLFTYGPVPFDQADKVLLKETEVGSVPEHWAVAPLGQLARLQSGGTPSKQRPEYWSGPIPWASPKDLKRPRLHDAEDHISREGLENGSRLVPAGAVFIVVRGMILGRDIPVALTKVPMAFNQDMKAILPGDRLDGEFLLAALTRHKGELLHEIGSAAHGTKRIGTSAIEHFAVPLPPLAEQHRIAEAILQTDVKIEKEANRRQALEALFQTLLHDLMTGKVRVADLDASAESSRDGCTTTTGAEL